MFSGFGRYAELFPEYFAFVKIRSVRGNVAVVEERMSLGGASLVMMTKHVTTEPTAHDVFVIGGNVRGSIRERFAGDETASSVTIDIDMRFRGAMRLHGMLIARDIKRDYGALVGRFIQAAEP